MLNRILNLLGIGTLYFAASMFFAQTLLFTYFMFAWGIDRDRMNQIVATAQGYDLYKMQEETRKEQIDRIQQLTYDAVLQERANRGTQSDMETARSGVLQDSILAEIRQFEDQKRRFQEVVRSFEKRLADVEKERTSAGFTELVTKLSERKPDLAKKDIMKMIDDKREDQVVNILKAMEETPRKKLLNTLKEDDEIDKLADIFRRIVDGEPEKQIISDTRDELSNRR